MGTTLLILGAIAFATALIIVNEHLIARPVAKSDKGTPQYRVDYPTKDGYAYPLSRPPYEQQGIKVQDYNSLRREVSQLKAALFLLMLGVAVFIFFMASS